MKMKTKSSVAIFILTHKRSNNQITLQTLNNAHCEIPIYLLLDDEDETLDEYKKLYSDSVLVFNKEKYVNDVDTITNNSKRNSVLYARNAAQDIAKKMKLDYYFEFDDDINSIKFRYNDNGSLRGKDVKNITDVVDYMVNYMNGTNIDILAFGNAGSYIGGLHGRFQEGLSQGRCNQAMLIRTSTDLKWKGIFNEDAIMYCTESIKGRLIFEVLNIAITSPARGTNEGGLNDLYNTSNNYAINFYSIITNPSCCKLKIKNGNVKLNIKYNNEHNVILNEKYKK